MQSYRESEMMGKDGSSVMIRKEPKGEANVAQGFRGQGAMVREDGVWET